MLHQKLYIGKGNSLQSRRPQPMETVSTTASSWDWRSHLGALLRLWLVSQNPAWSPQSSKLVIHLGDTCWHLLQLREQRVCRSSELKRLEFKSSETPSHPVGVSTLCLPHLFLRISRERGGALGWWHIPWCPAGSSRTQCHIPPVQPPAWPRSQGVPQRP